MDTTLCVKQQLTVYHLCKWLLLIVLKPQPLNSVHPMRRKFSQLAQCVDRHTSET